MSVRTSVLSLQQVSVSGPNVWGPSLDNYLKEHEKTRVTALKL